MHSCEYVANSIPARAMSEQYKKKIGFMEILTTSSPIVIITRLNRIVRLQQQRMLYIDGICCANGLQYNPETCTYIDRL